MKFKKLGNTDLDVSLICLGTMTWGTQNTQKDAFEQMNYSVEKGINFFDTAEIYSVPPTEKSYGKTEEIIGNWFGENKNRKKIVLASKIAGPGCSWIRGGKNCFTEKNIEKAIDGSLKRLKTDYIDLYQLHWPERSTNYFGKREYVTDEQENEWNEFELILESLEKNIKKGKIRYIGVSNETPYGLSKYLETSKNKNLPRMMSVQNPYSLLNRTYEIGLAEISVRERSGLLAYSPLAGGFLSGKYRQNKMPEKSRQKLFGDYFTRYTKTHVPEIVEKYFKISSKYNLNFAQMSLKFCEIQKFITSVIIGATTMEQLKTNVESVNVKFNTEIINEINKIHAQHSNPCP